MGTTTATQARETRFVQCDESWRFESPTAEQNRELLHSLEDGLETGTMAHVAIAGALTMALATSPDWIEGLGLRGRMRELIGRVAEAENDYRRAYEIGTKLLPPGFREEINGHEPSNRGFLAAASSLAHLLNEQGRYKEAVPLLRRILRWNPTDNLGVRFALGPALLRAGRPLTAEKALKRTASEDPGMGYELGLARIEREAWAEAATALRRADADNPYLAPTLCGMTKPPGMALWLGSNMSERVGATTYVQQWGPRWTARPEAIDFVWWLHTHPRVMAERAAILAPVEELMWEHDNRKRGPLVEVNDHRKEAIDDTLSREIVEPRLGRAQPA